MYSITTLITIPYSIKGQIFYLNQSINQAINLKDIYCTNTCMIILYSIRIPYRLHKIYIIANHLHLAITLYLQ
jgi:hypothetical protein